MTVVDVAGAVAAGEGARAAELSEAWIDAAWGAWSIHHDTVRDRADELAARFLRD